jgi:hypothetical protein
MVSREFKVWLRLEAAYRLSQVTRGLYFVTGRINGLGRNVQALADRLRRRCI